MGRYESAKLWFTKAARDLRSAKLNIGVEDPDIELVAFLSQQCAEKAVKGFLIFHGKRTRKTHDMKNLAELVLKVDPMLEPMLRLASILTPYAVKSRYPDADIEISEAMAKDSIEIAESIFTPLLDLVETDRV